MRTLAIGDIHGCNVALTCLLEQVKPRADDQIIFLGDYIDRGPESRAVINAMIGMTAICTPVFLRGNHEVMLLNARTDELKASVWQSCGGLETLFSYDAAYDPAWPAKIPETHWKFFEDTVRYFETNDHIFVHASLDAEVDMADQPHWLLHWEFVERMKPHKSGKRVICGHSHQYSGQILDLGFGVCIDTGAAYGGWLTCLDITTGQWWQANDKKEVRQGALATIKSLESAN